VTTPPPRPGTSPPRAGNAADQAGHWFEALADHLGEAYLRYSFTRGTAQEVDFLIEALQLDPGDRVLDVGCGPGRHARALAERGLVVHGVDISDRFIEIASIDAPTGATFAVADARHLRFDGEFDAVISLCQGAFGLTGGPAAADVAPGVELDQPVLEGIARALRAGGRVAVSAFSAYFAVRWQEEADTFDAEHGVNHERTELRGPDGDRAMADLWTTCYTPRELRLLARAAGLSPTAGWSDTPGRYERTRPSTEPPEFLLVAEKGPAGPEPTPDQ
jgi:SAM-dependent methyltransferase